MPVKTGPATELEELERTEELEDFTELDERLDEIDVATELEERLDGAELDVVPPHTEVVNCPPFFATPAYCVR